MPTKAESYRFRNGVTALDEREFNSRFFDVDGRLGALEQISIDWDAALQTLRDVGLSRLADLLAQINQQAQEAAAAHQTTFEAAEVQRDVVMAAALAAATAALAADQQTFEQLAADLNAIIANNEGAGAALVALQLWRDTLNPTADGFIRPDRLRSGSAAITYNGDGSVAQMDTTLPGGSTYRQAFTYSQDGSVATVTATVGAVMLWTRSYTYDGAGMLTGWTEA